MKLSNDIIDIIKKGSQDARIYVCSKSFLAFSIYYFSDFFTFLIPEFHEDFYIDGEKLISGELTEVAWIAFRESAKTSIAKMLIIWCICYNKKRYICYDSYDKDNAEGALFDIVVELQTNSKIIADFGHLYNEKRERDESKMKRISSFITSNKIRVRAFSTQESTRGLVFKSYRPDFFILDDIETIRTRESKKLTRKIIAHIREMRGGLGVDASTLYLGNYITEVGVIAYVLKKVADSPTGQVRNIAVKNKKGDIVWKDKYVNTDTEANKINKNIPDSKRHKVSLEAKLRDLGDRAFNEDMMNDPEAAGEPFFDRKRIDADLLKCTDPIEEKAGLRIYAKYNAAHRYAFGADTSMGIRLDSNADVGFDFSTLPIKQVASYDSNEISPDIFAHELHRHSDLFGTCLVAPETNAKSGGTCLNELMKIHPKDKIYRQVQEGKLHNSETNKLGWDTNSATKPQAFFKFRTDYEDGLVEINDPKILKEMRSYTKHDLVEDIEPDIDDETTNHFDLLTAVVIAYAMKDHAKAQVVKKDKYVQADYETPGLSVNPKRQ